MKRKQLLKALWLIVVPFFLAACSQTEGKPGDDRLVYAADFLEISTDGTLPRSVRGWVYLDGNFYGYTDVTGEETNNENGSVIYRVGTDDRGVSRFSGYIPSEVVSGLDTESENTILTMFAGTNGNLSVIEKSREIRFAIPDSFDPEKNSLWDYVILSNEEHYYLRMFDVSGAEEKRVSLDAAGLYGFVSSAAVDADGNIYVASLWELTVLNSEGELLFSIPIAEKIIEQILVLDNGEVGVICYASGNMDAVTYLPIDPEMRGFGEPITLPGFIRLFGTGAEGYDFCYSYLSGFFGYSVETGQSEKLFDWIDLGVENAYIQAIGVQDDGRITAITVDGAGAIEIADVSKRAASTLKERVTLTYACFNLNYRIKSEILHFNRTNKDYVIKVTDYAQYATNDDYWAGIKQLNMELLAGQVPDMFDATVEELPIGLYSQRGYLEDLWPYIETDRELSRDALVKPLYDTLTRNDGKLYQLVTSFNVQTVAAPASLGLKAGWTFDDLYAIDRELPGVGEIFGFNFAKQDLLRLICLFGLDKYVDWSAGKCYFDSEDFIRMLELTEQYPLTIEYNSEYDPYYKFTVYGRFVTGSQLFRVIAFFGFESETYQESARMIGEDIAFIGYPFEGLNGGVFSCDGGAIAMSSVCKDKDGAWEFMRTFLTEEWQRKNITSWAFPVNQKVFDEQLAAITTPRYVTDPVTGSQEEETYEDLIGPDLTWELRTFLYPEEAQQIVDLINGTDSILAMDETLMQIIMDECGAYFAGQKSSRETAANIQNRVNLYVNEQR